MIDKPRKGGTIPAIDRFFRQLQEHTHTNNLDTLFNLLNGLHSLNDKMNGEYSTNLFDVPEFLVMKALRNYYQHEDELRNEVRFFQADGINIMSSLFKMCLIQRTALETAMNSEKTRGDREAQLAAMRKCLSWYGPVVDINPCLFNLGVHVCQKIEELGIEGQVKGEDFNDFYGDYLCDIEGGHPIYVKQGFSSTPGEMEKALKSLFGIERQKD